MAASTEKQVVREQAEKILQSTALGRSRFYTSLLEYLLDCSDRGHVPKEIEIAAAVFNRGDDFDPSQDSMVRVYAHNLRQKLQQYYADQGADEPDQITIPKGEYRLALASADSEILPQTMPRPGVAGYRLGLVVALSLVTGLLLGTFSFRGEDADVTAHRAVAASPLWAGVTDDDAPVTLVVGDYYIFGELDRYGNVVRMVREFDINSPRDLDDRFMLEPEDADRYIDLALTYLPTSMASALVDLMSVLTAAGKDVTVVAISNLDTSVIREGHVVYVGYLSGLGMLRNFAFAGSSLVIGETFDELVNQETGSRYVSEAGLPNGRGSYRDYGLFSTVVGPGGNQLVFVAGMRDEGLMQTAEAVTDPGLVADSIMAVTAADGTVPDAFELVYEVAGLDRTNLAATIVHSAPLGDARVAVGRLSP